VIPRVGSVLGCPPASFPYFSSKFACHGDLANDFPLAKAGHAEKIAGSNVNYLELFDSGVMS
jgi:hypothetical protein